MNWYDYTLDTFSLSSPDVPQKQDQEIRAMPWVADGIEITEMGGLEGLLLLAVYNEDAFSNVIEQLWVTEGAHPHALQSLGLLAQSDRRAHPPTTYLDTVLTHPTITDGITDDEAAIVATLYSVARYGNPELITTFLEGDVLLEKRAIVTPRSGELSIYIIRSQPGADRTMDLIEESIRTQEDFMDAPWPSKSIIHLFAGEVRNASAYFAGPSILTVAIVDSDTISMERSLRVLAHENGHYFWNGGDRWIVEAGAVILERITRHDHLGWPVEADLAPCQYSSSLSDNRYQCAYQAGQRLLLDLYYQLDETSFRLAFRRLYQWSLYRYDEVSHCMNYYWAPLCHVDAAFKFNATPQEEAIVDEAINRWYWGTVSLESRVHNLEDTTPVDPVIADKNIRIEQAWVSGAQNGDSAQALSLGEFPSNTTEPLFLTLEYSYDSSAHESDLLLEIVLYSRRDGFTYGRNVYNLEIDPQSGNRDRASFRMGSRTWMLGAPGEYAAYVYHDGQKIGEASFEVIP